MSDIASRAYGLVIARFDNKEGLILREQDGTEIPAWTVDDDVIERLIRSESYFQSKSADDVERAVFSLLDQARLQRIANGNVLKRFGRAPR